MTNPAPVEVTQADRDAAAAMCEIWQGTASDSGEIRAGDLDEWHVVQAFARHRLASPPALPSGEQVERVAKLAADIMAAVRTARFPAEYYAEAHDEFESLTLTPMLAAALTQPDTRRLAHEEAAKVADGLARMCADMPAHVEPQMTNMEAWDRVRDAAEDIAQAIRALTKDPTDG